jgi:carbamoyl-phosphate synthase large subunit
MRLCRCSKGASKMNIIVTSAGRRVSLVREFQHELKSRKSNGKVYTCDSNPDLSSACQVSDGFFKVPSVSNEEYIDKLLSICIENFIRIVIPTIDPELLIFSNCRSRFEEQGVNIIVSSPEFISICRDKRLTHKYFDQYRINRASDIDISRPLFPFFVKPYDGSCSEGAFIVEDENAMSSKKFVDPRNMFLQYLSASEHIEYTIDLYYNRGSELACCVPRRRIEIRSGEVNKTVTEKNFIVPFILEKMKYLHGVVGCINFQIFVHNESKEIYGIEINPRFGGGYPLSYNAGANFPKWIIDEYVDDQTIEYFDGWETNLLMLRYDDEIIVRDYLKY